MIALAEVSSYRVGDYVYTSEGRPGGRRLAHIESAHPLQSNDGPIWLVRERMRSGWTSGQIHRPIERALDSKEVAHCRRLGLIPAEGEALR